MLDFFIRYPLPLLASAGVFFLLSLFLLLHQRRLRLSQQDFQQRLQQLTCLRTLITALQRHRGLSSGVLSGDQSLQADLDSTRRQLDTQIETAKSLMNSHQEAWGNLFDHWSRLREGRMQNLDNCLAQHHLIIRNSIFLLQDLASSLEMDETHAEVALSCIWQEVIQAAEWAGQARALGTSMAAAQASSAEQRIRLRFLYQKIEELSNKAFSTLQTSPLGKRFNLAPCQASIHQLLQCIDQDLLNDEAPQISARVYFQQATQAIDRLFELVDANLEALEKSWSA